MSVKLSEDSLKYVDRTRNIYQFQPTEGRIFHVNMFVRSNNRILHIPIYYLITCKLLVFTYLVELYWKINFGSITKYDKEMTNT